MIDRRGFYLSSAMVNTHTSMHSHIRFLAFGESIVPGKVNLSTVRKVKVFLYPPHKTFLLLHC